MPNVIRKITYSKKSGEEWGSEIELETASMQEVVIGWGSQKDSASVQLSKGSKYYDDQNNDDTPDIEEEDLVRFYVAKDKSIPHTFTTDDLLFEGTVDNSTQTLNGQGNISNVKTFNFYEVFFDVELPYYEENYNCIEHAKELLNLINKAGTPIQWDSDNPTLKKDGVTAFPKKALALDYTPAFVIMEKFMSSDFTDDGQYYWYLSKDSTGQRKLSIRAKDDTLSGTIDETFPINSISIEKGKDNTVNYIIFNCGTDLYGYSVEDFIFDAGSIGKYGWKTHYLIEETGQLFASIFREEVEQNSGSFSFDSNNNLSDSFPTSYPYTFHFDSSISVNNDSDFNEQIKIEALSQGQEIAQAELDETAKNQYMVNIELPFRNDLAIGGLYSFDLQKLRKFDKQLRLKQITYTLSGITASFDQDTKDRDV